MMDLAYLPIFDNLIAGHLRRFMAIIRIFRTFVVLNRLHLSINHLRGVGVGVGVRVEVEVGWFNYRSHRWPTGWENDFPGEVEKEDLWSRKNRIHVCPSLFRVRLTRSKTDFLRCKGFPGDLTHAECRMGMRMRRRRIHSLKWSWSSWFESWRRRRSSAGAGVVSAPKLNELCAWATIAPRMQMGNGQGGQERQV